eukprot:7670155-Heterocapsa_arctica.AAC.1
MEPCRAHGQQYYDGGGTYEHNRENEARHSGNRRAGSNGGYGGNGFGGAEREHERGYCDRKITCGAYGHGRRADQSETKVGVKLERRAAAAL